MRRTGSSNVRFVVMALLLLGSLAAAACGPAKSSQAPAPVGTTPATATISAKDASATPQAAPDEVRIRVANAGSVPMAGVKARLPSGEVEYGAIQAGSQSDYAVVAKAYRYAYVTFLVDGVRKTLQPIDYVGESLLKPGDYTYVVRCDASARGEYSGLDLKLRRD